MIHLIESRGIISTLEEDAVKKNGLECVLVSDFEDIDLNELSPGDVVVFHKDEISPENIQKVRKHGANLLELDPYERLERGIVRVDTATLVRYTSAHQSPDEIATLIMTESQTPQPILS
jgi:hypothetical protein